MKVICSHCGKETDKSIGEVNRAKKVGLRLFCNSACFGLDRRVNRTKEEWIKIKADYDRKRRAELKDVLKAKNKAYNESPAGRAMQKRHQEKRKEQHKEYIRSERYRKWKQAYDEKYHAKKNYGEFYEAALILKTIEVIIEPEKLECKIQKGTYNKSQKRKRQWNSRPRI